jgi:biopolymer transport protein TolQ
MLRKRSNFARSVLVVFVIVRDAALRRSAVVATQVPSYQMFDSAQASCYPARQSAPSQRRVVQKSILGDQIARSRGRLITSSVVIVGGTLRMSLYALALHAQGAGQPDPGAGELTRRTDIVTLLADATPLAKAVLLILLLFSAVSWAIILYKIWIYRRAERQTATFLNVFRKSSKFSEVQAVCPTLQASPLVGIFQSGYAELNAQLRTEKPDSEATRLGAGRPTAVVGRPTLKSLDAVDRALLRATTVELTRLEHRVPFLATTASITPFIGLFGTVWGIMMSFQAIGISGSTSLQSVGPGIADALVATAAGLFAAIPAVYFYNHFTNRVKHFAAEMDDFSLEFLNISERNFT